MSRSTYVEGECILSDAVAQIEPVTSEASEIEPGASLPCLSLLSDEYLVGLTLGEQSELKVDWDVAFAALVERHRPAVRRVVRGIIRRSPDVDDVVQSAFMLAYRSLRNLKDRSRFKYWVRIIAANEARDLARNRPQRAGLDELMILPERSNDRMPAEAAEATWLLEELNNRLPEEYMKILYLRYYLDYTVNEVAEMLGIRPGLVKWRANRARRLAKKALTEGGAVSDAVSKDDGTSTKGGYANG